MQFASLQFLIFFPIVVVAYFRLPQRWRWVLLLAAGAYFYMAFVPGFILLLGFVILAAYAFGRLLEAKKGRGMLHLGLLLVLSPLIFYKYLDFLGGVVLGSAFVPSNLIQPLGISFYSLQAVSYLIEVQAARLPAERHPGYLALFLMFFPLLLSGPIERPGNLLPQFHKKQTFEYDRVVNGLLRMAYGFFQKLVIADRLALIVNPVYGAPEAFVGPQLLVGTLLFSIQIYCDFDGYSNIAIGAAQVLGIRVMENFRQPYFAKSVTEFWQRWHISFSSWLRDYVYFPLARVLRAARWRWLALLVAFLVSGIWHGEAWTYVIWGGLYGIYLSVEVYGKRVGQRFAEATRLAKRPRLLAGLQMAITFALVSLTWVWFRAEDVAQALYIFNHLGGGYGEVLTNLTNYAAMKELLIQMGFNPRNLLISASAISMLLYVDMLADRGSVRNRLRAQRPTLRWAAYYALVAAIVFLGVYGDSQFIYFQF